MGVLEEVDVGHNRIAVKGAEAIARGIQESTTLLRFQLNDNPLQDRGCAAIVRALRDNKIISMVDLRDTGAGKETDTELKETLQSKPESFHIDLPRSLFQPEGW